MTSSPDDAVGRLKGRLGDARDHLAADLAVERGLLKAGDLERCLEEAAEGQGTLAMRLALNGFLDAAQMEQVRRDLAGEELKATARIARPPEVDEAAQDPAKRIGRYVTVAELGRGGMGVVYKAWQDGLGRWVALKVLRSEASTTSKARFLREAQLAAKVVHPNLVPVHEVSEEGGVACIAMTYMEGGSLEGRVFPPREALAIMCDVARAVEEVHRNGIVHRDVKPANLLRDNEGRVYLGDFGLARPVEEDVRLSVSGTMIGTVSYAPPEQISGRRGQLGPTSDVYAMGATLYALLCGHPPFEGQDVISTAQKVLDEDFVPLRTRNPDLHRDLDSICSRAMEKRAEDRYPTALEFGRDLRRFLDGESVEARRIPAHVRLARWVRRRAVPVAAAAVVLAAAAAAVGLRLADRAAQRRADELRTAQDRARSGLEEARRLLSGGRPEGKRARERLDGILADPAVASAPDIRAEARFLLGETEAAERDYTAALAAAPDDPKLLSGRGRARLERAAWMIQDPPRAGVDWRIVGEVIAAAAKDFERAAAIGGPAWDAGHLPEAYACVIQRRFADAVGYCEKAINDNSPELGYETVLGTALLLAGNPPAALKAFGEAIRRSPNQAFASFGHAAAAERSGDLETAAADYARVVELRPSCTSALLNRAWILHRLRRFEEAIALYDQALAADPGDERTRAARIKVRFDSGEQVQARRDAEVFISERPKSAVALTQRGDLRLDLGDDIGAEADYSAAIARDPAYPLAWAGRGIARKKQENYELAIEDLDTAMRLGEHPYRVSGWIFHRGVCRSNRRQWPEAFEDFDRAIKMDPGDGAYWVNRGLARLALRGDRDAIRRDLEEGVRRAPSLAPSVERYLKDLRREE